MPKARRTDPVTSHEAAHAVSGLTMTQFYVWLALNQPRTDVELVENYNSRENAPRASESGIRSRRSELVKSGMVRDSGVKKILPSGRRAVVWEAVNA